MIVRIHQTLLAGLGLIEPTKNGELGAALALTSAALGLLPHPLHGQTLLFADLDVVVQGKGVLEDLSR
jgi:hypothetical protein